LTGFGDLICARWQWFSMGVMRVLCPFFSDNRYHLNPAIHQIHKRKTLIASYCLHVKLILCSALS